MSPTFAHKTAFIASFIAALIAHPTHTSAQVAVGAFGGVNMSGINGDAPSGAKLKTRTGFAAGAVAELQIASDVHLSLQPMYLQRGATIAFKVSGEDEPRDSLDVALDYLSVPVLVKIVSGNGKTYVSGGLEAGYLLNATLTGRGPEEDVKDVFATFDLAADFGFGVMLPIGAPLLTIEARYSQSILNAANRENAETSLPVRFRSTGLQLYAGILFRLGRKG